MKERQPEIIYSEPVKEIMGNPPRMILRWGTALIFIVFLLFILFSWLIRYPDTIPSPIEITTINPPVMLVSKISGRIKNIYVKDREMVRAGELVAVMETTASVDEINKLKAVLDSLTRPELISVPVLPYFSELGELQVYYASFLKNLADLNSYNINDYYGNKILSVNEEIKAIHEYLRRLKIKEALFYENHKFEARKYARDSLLFSDSLIPESELENSRQALIRIKISLEEVRLDYSAKSIELAEKHQMLDDYKIKRVEEREKLITILDESFLNLKAQLTIWENNYLLVSPVDGIAAFTKFWSVNQSVLKDEPVMSIVPVLTGEFIGRITLRMQRSGKVKPGQLVNIKLTDYPYMQYGMIRGVVKSKSLVPTSDAYIIEIDLPDALTTLYGIKLEFTQNMQGVAEVITDDIRLLQKIVNPFRYMVSKNKR
jgi:hypothetical protein